MEVIATMGTAMSEHELIARLEALCRHASLERLQLRGVRLNGRVLACLRDVCDSVGLVALEFQTCRFADDAVEAMREFLFRARLRELVCVHSVLREQLSGFMMAVMIARDLRFVTLDFTDVDIGMMRWAADLLYENGMLQKLRLRSKYFLEDIRADVSAAIRDHACVTDVDLRSVSGETGLRVVRRSATPTAPVRRWPEVVPDWRVDTAEMRNWSTTLVIRRSDLHGFGVFATTTIPSGTRLGYYRGEVVPDAVVQAVVGGEELLPYGITIQRPSDGATFVVDAQDASKANWVRFVNDPHGSARGTNVEYQPEALLVTTREVRKGEELCVSYGSEYWR
jgi:hypothetical protein